MGLKITHSFFCDRCNKNIVSNNCGNIIEYPAGWQWVDFGFSRKLLCEECFPKWMVAKAKSDEIMEQFYRR